METSSSTFFFFAHLGLTHSSVTRQQQANSCDVREIWTFFPEYSHRRCCCNEPKSMSAYSKVLWVGFTLIIIKSKCFRESGVLSQISDQDVNKNQPHQSTQPTVRNGRHLLYEESAWAIKETKQLISQDTGKSLSWSSCSERENQGHFTGPFSNQASLFLRDSKQQSL